MGSFFKSKTEVTQSPFETNPWEPQQQYLEKGFQSSLGALNSAMNFFKGRDPVADMGSTERNALNQMTRTGINGFSDLGQRMREVGLQDYGALSRAMDNLGSGAYQKIGGAMQQFGLNGMQDFGADMVRAGRQNIAQTGNKITNIGLGAIQGVGQDLTAAGREQIGYLGQAGKAFEDIYNQFSGDQTDTILSNAQKYANDPYLQGQIDSALGDVNKAFRRDVGGINAGAVSSGNMNSTRAGVLEAIAQDDAMDRSASISSGMRGAAYQAGLDRSMTTNQNQFNNSLAAASGLQSQGALGADLMQAGADTRLAGLNAAAMGADTTAQGWNIAQQGMDARAMGYDLARAGADTKAAGLGLRNDALSVRTDGLGLAQQGLDLRMAGLGTAADAQAALRAQRQGEMDGRAQMAGMPLELVQAYMQAIGGNYGQQGFTSQVSKSPSMFQQLVGGAASIAGAF